MRKELIKAIAFDCFNTVFVLHREHYDQVKDYSKHVNKAEFTPYRFPDSWYELDSHADAVEGIRILREKGYYCVAMSNGSPDLILSNSQRSGIIWDYIMDLAKHKVYKPNPDAYPLIQLETGICSENVLMVTANPTFGDVEGSQLCGMQSCIVSRSGNCKFDILDLAHSL